MNGVDHEDDNVDVNDENGSSSASTPPDRSPDILRYPRTPVFFLRLGLILWTAIGADGPVPCGNELCYNFLLHRSKHSPDPDDEDHLTAWMTRENFTKNDSTAVTGIYRCLKRLPDLLLDAELVVKSAIPETESGRVSAAASIQQTVWQLRFFANLLSESQVAARKLIPRNRQPPLVPYVAYRADVKNVCFDNKHYYGTITPEYLENPENHDGNLINYEKFDAELKWMVLPSAFEELHKKLNYTLGMARESNEIANLLEICEHHARTGNLVEFRSSAQLVLRQAEWTAETAEIHNNVILKTIKKLDLTKKAHQSENVLASVLGKNYDDRGPPQLEDNYLRGVKWLNLDD